MNLFNIDDSIKSHPEYQYKEHVKNIIDSFESRSHRISALYHDIGKLSNEFQDYINKETRKKTTHSFESGLAFLIDNNYELTPENFYILFAIIKHHSNLPDIDMYAENYLADEFNYSNKKDKLKAIFNKAKITKGIDLDDIPDLFDTESFTSDNQLASLESYFKIKEIFSRLIFADKYEAIFKESYKESVFDKVDEYLQKLSKVISSKSNKLSNIRNSARTDILNKYHQNSEKRIFIIEAPTGIGKTFTALQLSLEIVRTKNKKRIITALPLTSVIDQTYKEYSKIIDTENLLKYHHLTHAKDYSSSDEEEDPSDKQKNEYIGSSWCQDKVIVTTFNQVFNAFYSNRNKDLTKFWTLRDSVVILDEIQNIPHALLQDIAKTLNFLSEEFDIDFILMSATIPSIKQFLENNVTEELLSNKYFFQDFNNRYTLKIDQKIDTVDVLIRNIHDKFRKYNSLLCVVNSKKLSLNIFEKLEADYPEDALFLLNANFIPHHRKQIIEKVDSNLRNRNKKTILVSTQVVEAGVDFDFNYGFREFAPLGSIIQTAGRINREGLYGESYLVVTNKIGASPYDTKDVLYDDVIDLLPEEISENEILPLLKKYFDLVIRRTRPDLLLIDSMINLDFISVYKFFEDNFMKGIPNLASIFIEIEPGLHDKFSEDINSIIKKLKKDLSLKEKLTLKNQLKGINKEISSYVISVPFDQANKYLRFNKDSEMFYCPYNLVADGNIYCSRKGWINKPGYISFNK